MIKEWCDTLRIREVKHAFTRKLGAEEDSSGDHTYFYFEYQGSEYTVGKLSHSWSGNLNDTQILLLGRKLFLKKREFEEWVDCTLSNDKMIEVWLKRRKELA